MGDHNYHSYEPPSLAPLQITPAMMAQARATQGAPRPPPDPPATEVQPQMTTTGNDEHIDTLAAMFPDYDRDVLASILAMSNGLDDTIQQLIEMGGGALEGVANHESDEELALALFKQFAEDLEQQLGRPIPDDVRSDPVRYEAFVRDHFERELARDGSQLSTRAAQMYAANYSPGGAPVTIAPAQQESLMERVRKMPSLFGKSRLGMVNVADGAKPLLLAEHGEGDGASSHNGRPEERR